MVRGALHSVESLENRDLQSAPHGKRGFLSLGFQLNAEGRSIMRHWERRTPLIVQQELYFDEQMPLLPCVYILSAGGPMLSGDRFEQHFSVDEGAMAYISTGAATKVAEMELGEARQQSYFRLSEGAYLEYLPEAVIPCRGSRFCNISYIEIAESATLVMAEIYLAGRKYYGEVFQFEELLTLTRALRPSGELLYSEWMIVSPRSQPPQEVGLMGGFEIWASVVVLTPKAFADKIYDKAEARSLPNLMVGVNRLPNECGLQFKVLGRSSGEVKAAIREICSSVRLAVKGRPLPEEFRWR